MSNFLQEGKMIHCVFAILAILIALSSCMPGIQVTPPSVISNSATPSSIPTATQTLLPTQTPTASITPLPTIPTFTSTFDASTILTVTPALKAGCPEIDPTVKIGDYLPEKLEYPSPDTTSKILDFLNEGGDGQTLIERLEQIYPNGGDFRGGYGFYDVTGDQNPEFLYVEINYEGKLLAFSCKNGKYELLATCPKEMIS